MITIARRIGLLFVLLAGLPSPSASGQAPPHAMPDARFDAGPIGFQFYESGDRSLSMRVSHDLTGRKLRITSQYFYDVPARRALTKESLESTPFWPTCSTRFANGKICLAGKSPRTGHNIIELWTVTPPMLPPAGPGQAIVDYLPGKVVDKVEVLEAPATGMGVVMRLQAMLTPTNSPTHVLVQFHESRDIWSLNVTSGAMVRVASPAAHPDCLTVPLLGQELISQVRQHTSEGYMYIYSKRGAPGSEASIAILRDTNKDSIIDGFSMHSLLEYQAAGYAAAGSWID